MNVTKKSIILAAIFLVISLLIYIYSNFLVKDPEFDKTLFPSFVITDGDISIYDKNGKLSKTLVATKITYYESKQLYELENPFVTTYEYSSDGKVNLWHLKAEKGNYIVDKSVTVTNNVVIFPGFENSNIKKATAKYLDYDLQKELITSDDLVTIYGDKFKTEGTVFSFDTKNNVLTYKGQPHAVFYPNNQ